MGGVSILIPEQEQENPCECTGKAGIGHLPRIFRAPRAGNVKPTFWGHDEEWEHMGTQQGKAKRSKGRFSLGKSVLVEKRGSLFDDVVTCTLGYEFAFGIRVLKTQAP